MSLPSQEAHNVIVDQGLGHTNKMHVNDGSVVRRNLPLQHHALTAYLRSGKWMSFLCCFTVLNDVSCYRLQQVVSVPQPRSYSVSHLGHSPSDCTSLLWPEIKREVFLVLVVLAQILTRLVVHHRQDPCNRFAHGVTVSVLERESNTLSRPERTSW